MGILPVPVLLIFAAFLAGCAAHVPVYNTSDSGPMTAAPAFEAKEGDDVPTDRPDRTSTIKEIPAARKSKQPVPKSIAASTTPRKETINPTAVNVGSPEKWEQERAEDERKERHLKQVIEGICRGC